MINVIQGTVVGITDFKKEFEENPQSLPFLYFSVFSTLELKYKLIDRTSREGGLVKSRVVALSNDIHNLTLYIKIINDIIDKTYPTNKLEFLFLGVIVQAYFTSIRSAYDTIVLPIKFFMQEQIKAQLPSEESMNKLINWADKKSNKGKLPEKIENALMSYKSCFENVKNIRDYFIHKGGTPIIFTLEDGQYAFAVQKSSGDSIAQNILGEEDSHIFRIIPYIREVTVSLLDFIEDMGEAIFEIMGEMVNENPPKLFGAALVGKFMPNIKEFIKSKD